MPMFFDPDNLTEQQKANWYNATTQYLAMREAEAAKMDGAHKPYIDLFWNQPGNPKSALFARLLEGKAPLAVAPPTSFSYPAYRFVEEAGPHNVHVDLFHRSLSINQEGYKVVGANKAAKALRSFYWRRCNSIFRKSLLKRRTRRQLSSLLEKGPVFTLEYNGYRFQLAYRKEAAEIVGRRYSVMAKYAIGSDMMGGFPLESETVSEGDSPDMDVVRALVGCFQIQNVDFVK